MDVMLLIRTSTFIDKLIVKDIAHTHRSSTGKITVKSYFFLTLWKSFILVSSKMGTQEENVSRKESQTYS